VEMKKDVPDIPKTYPDTLKHRTFPAQSHFKERSNEAKQQKHCLEHRGKKNYQSFLNDEEYTNRSHLQIKTNS